ncbi:synaptic vesicle glycoprotein 2B isoform X2 [Diabrotica virgifera virgifera]|uniref:Synaptic vesicle glycoprotein 2B-like isoform X2 n=1 Tax=Diabrotica virgifera virgifera TaxID=50390 RepID=A0A6P7F4R9_DIAVI|nr:synaptic vesicle glycoprotein 2B isoform X2 [Diabrotica virgifera virgifera]
MEFCMHYEPKPSVKSIHGPTTFEEAIEKTSFGKFNILLIIATICGIFAPIFETTTMSYIFAPAQCDLNLSLQDKGMISTSFVWGFLLDTFGRRKFMIYGYFLDAIVVFLSSCSQSIEMLMLSKFLGGVIINGPFAAMTTYLGEFHSAQYRSKIQLVKGALVSVGQLVLPLLAWGIVPLPVDWSLFNGLIHFHSWNLYLFVCGLFPLASAVIFCFLPESPKFLMTIGENEKAMKVLQKVYSINTGKRPETYPVKELLQETDESHKNRSIKYAMTEEFSNLFPLFKAPYFSKFALLCTVQFMVVQSMNVLRLWSPQLFQAIEDYKVDNNGTTADLCSMMDTLKPKIASSCTTNVGNPGVYINSIIVSTSAIAGYFVTISVINLLGKKPVIVSYALTSGICSMALYFSQSVEVTTFLIAVFIALGNIVSNVLQSVVVDHFPTNLRAFTVSLVMGFARIGALTGNIGFPFLVSLGCAPPFFVVGGIMAVGSLCSILLPKTDNKALI